MFYRKILVVMNLTFFILERQTRDYRETKTLKKFIITAAYLNNENPVKGSSSLYPNDILK